MTPPVWVLELARELPAPARFPRDLRGELAFGPANVVVVDLPRLTAGSVGEHLDRCGITVGIRSGELSLRGCVFAWRGEAILFVAADDPEDERRHTLAHELAHFLRHYRQPRRRCATLMGEGILGVLDGDRPPTPAEAIHAALRGVPLGPHVQLIGRTAVHAAEAEADRLACELLAPAAAVRSRLPPNFGTGDVERELTTTFGLPAGLARLYARDFVPNVPAGRGWPDSLRNILPKASNS